MNQKPKHTETSPSSYDAAAYGYDYRYDGFGGSAQASHGVALSRTLTEHRSYRDGERRYPELSRRVDQRGSNDIRFIPITIGITGKERDAETGFDYFGARYYDSDISVWLSVDPLAFKYPNESPYSYVGNRPINTIDPWGMDKVEDPNGNSGEAGDYKQTKDKQYLYGDGLKTKKWDPKAEGQGNQAGTESGAYVDYDGDAIDFDSYGKNRPSKKMANIADKIRNTPVFIIPGLPGAVLNPYYKAEAIVFGGTGTLVGGEYGKGGYFVLAGKDKGSFLSYTEKAGGVSSDIFLGSSNGRVDYTGDSRYFTSQMLFGKRLKGWVGVGEGLSGGVSLSRSLYGSHSVYTTEVNFGFGVSVIPFIGIGGNTGVISR